MLVERSQGGLARSYSGDVRGDNVHVCFSLDPRTEPKGGEGELTHGSFFILGTDMFYILTSRSHTGWFLVAS